VTPTNVEGRLAQRAYIDSPSKSRLYVHVLWQEDWSTNPFARDPFVKGKVVYQKLVAGAEFFARQYEIHGAGALSISDFEEGPFFTPLPGDDVKKLWDFPVAEAPKS